MQAPAPEPPKRFPAHYLWAVLIARIYEVFPLVCPVCGGNMRIIGTSVTRRVQMVPGRGQLEPAWREAV